MAYSDFSLSKVKKTFNLIEQREVLFPSGISLLEPSDWLATALRAGLSLALASSSEKARSEFIVAPILLELEMRNNYTFSIFSGETLDAAPEQGLNGECDFILATPPLSSTIQTPIFSLVEAKKNDIKDGLGQCVAQMLGAQIFNLNEENQIDDIYGCVTTGESWQFLKLQHNVLSMDHVRYYIDNVNMLLGVFQQIIDHYKAPSLVANAAVK